MRTYVVELDEAKLRRHFGDSSLVIVQRYRTVAVECNPAVRPGAYGKQPVRHAIANIDVPGSNSPVKAYMYHRGKLSELASMPAKPRYALKAIVLFIARVVGYANMMGWNIDSARLTWGDYELGAYLCLFEGKLAHLFHMSYVTNRWRYRKVVGFEVEYIGHGVGAQTNDGFSVVLADKSIAFKIDSSEGSAKIIENDLITLRDLLLIKPDESTNR